MNLLFCFSMGGAKGPTAEIVHCRVFAPFGHAHPARHHKVQASKEAIRAKTNYSRSYLDFADAADWMRRHLSFAGRLLAIWAMANVRRGRGLGWLRLGIVGRPWIGRKGKAKA